MKKNLWLLLVLFLLTSASLLAVSVYDIQHSTAGGTYPSPLVGQTVTVNNVVVTAKGYSGSTYVSERWFISDPDGGPWSGLYVYDSSFYSTILVGDIINVTGPITEYNGFTELGPVTAVEVISRGNPIPEPVDITTVQLTQPAFIEQYESCLVQVRNVRVTALPSAGYNEWYVTDNSGPGQIDDGFSPVLGFTGLSPAIFVNETWVKIRGIIDYGHSEYAINPRSYQDLIRYSQISIPEIYTTLNNIVEIPIKTTALNAADNFKKFSFALKYDPQRLEIIGFTFDNTLLDSLGVADSLVWKHSTTYADTVYFSYSTPTTLACPTDSTLIIIKARTKLYGNAPLTLYDFKYNTISITSLTPGMVNIPVPKKQAFMNIYNPSYSNNPKYSLNHFNPKVEKIRIDFGGKTNGLSSPPSFKGIVRIYDSQGRLVTTLFNEIITSATGITSVDWNGRNSELNLVPIGLYYCQAELIDRSSGDKQTAVQPIVVGTKLK